MGTPYYDWLRGDCGCGCNEGCRDINPCDCDSILLSISKLETNDSILQDEIDYVSGVVDTISGGCDCDLTDYYTKEESDAKFLTEHQPLKTINNQVITGTGNIVIEASGTSITVDDHLDSASTNPVQNKVITEALNGKLDASAYTPTDLSNYVTISVLNQNILNLQEQINSLVSAISGCCGETGETQYRWVTMVGENDYWCSGTTKYSKEKEQSSTDGINWTDTGNIRSGSTILEENSVECGYAGGSRVQITYSSTTSPTKIANECSSNIESVHINSHPTPIIIESCVTTVDYALASGNTVTTDRYSTTIEDGEYIGTNMWFGGVSSEMTSIGNNAFSGNTQLSSFTIGNYSRYEPYNQNPVSEMTSIGNNAFKDCTNLKHIELTHSNTVPSLGTNVFDGCTSLTGIYVKSSMANAFKSAWPQYSSLIIGI